MGIKEDFVECKVGFVSLCVLLEDICVYENVMF